MLVLRTDNWRSWDKAYKFTPAITTMMSNDVRTIRQKIDSRTSEVPSLP